MSVASLYTPCFVMFCVFLYRPFCHGAYKLDLSTLFTPFFLWTSLPFIFRLSFDWEHTCNFTYTLCETCLYCKSCICQLEIIKTHRKTYNIIIISHTMVSTEFSRTQVGVTAHLTRGVCSPRWHDRLAMLRKVYTSINCSITIKSIM